MSKFKVGDRVKYVSGFWDDEKENPLWDGKHGKVVGIILDVDFVDSRLPYIIRWDNGTQNGYNECDLEFTKPPPFKVQDLTPEEQIMLRLEQVEYENARLSEAVTQLTIANNTLQKNHMSQGQWLREVQYKLDETRRYIDRFEDERREMRCPVPNKSYSKRS